MSDQVTAGQIATGESGIRGWIAAEFEHSFIQPVADFQNPRQEWRRLFSELFGARLCCAGLAAG